MKTPKSPVIRPNAQVERVPGDQLKGHIRIFEEKDPEHVLYSADNIIVSTVKWLFSRLMAESAGALSNPSGNNEAQFGVWGLALGAGDPSWAPETQPVETVTQTALITEFKRKQCSLIQYVDANLNPVSGLSLKVDFQTIVNATTDNITQPIREMGLIGGGTQSRTPAPPPFVVTPITDLSNPNTPYFNPLAPTTNSIILVNYKTTPPLPLPAGINLIFSWVLSFALLVAIGTSLVGHFSGVAGVVA
jgi:hypothetical protein